MSEDKKLPLEGLRVVDAADGVGELCGRMLADFGADVVRLEPPEGAVSRTVAPLTPDGASSLYFAYRNFNKRGISLDLASDQGKTELFRLLAGADIYLHSNRPFDTKGTDFAPDKLTDRFAHLIVVSLTAFGQTGPYADYEHTPDVVFALSGWLSSSGLPGKPPLLMPGPQTYDFAGIMGCFAALCALIQRRTTGRGQHLDVSAMESVAQCNTWQMANAKVTMASGMNPPTLRSGTSPVYPLFKTKDGYVRPVILSPFQWRALWDWMGKPEEFAAEEWAETLFRMMNLDVLNPYLERFFADFNMEECAAEGQKRGVVVVPMLKPGDVLKNEHYASRKAFIQGEATPGQEAAFVEGPVELARQRLGYRFGAPEVGQHNREVADEDWQPVWQTVQAPESGGEPAAPLAGLRVMDFGHGGVGVEAGKLLAQYGAETTKIETRTYFDFIRTMLSTEMNGSFASSNCSKRSFGVNLRTPQGCEIVHRMAADADIVIENNSTGTMDKMGIGYPDLRQTNPQIVMSSSQMMGSHGAYGNWIGYGPTIQTVSGLTWLWNFDDGDPPPGSIAIHPDHIAGRLAAVAALVGVWQRFETGEGCHLEQAQADDMMGLLADFFMQESLHPGSVRPRGNSSPRCAPWGVFQCAGEEEWCVVCVRSDDDWIGLRDAMGNPDWAHDPKYETVAWRLDHEAELFEKVSEWTAKHTPREVMETCQAHCVPAGAMLNVLQQIEDPHYQARGFMVETSQQDLGPDGAAINIYLEGPAFVGSKMVGPDIFQAPLLGEHTREQCARMGMSEEEIEGLIDAGILEVTKQEMAEREAAGGDA